MMPDSQGFGEAKLNLPRGGVTWRVQLTADTDYSG
ncbi:hypothetical protein LVISKB_1895 [Levilactobacillus brevis KB290]|uniref:Uncharacterized protein n=1 Tax=Levilactobacillus brevis KB290 TaxID=1001583 RepID=M5AGJ3_LEVBR|nr:hypothetical protein LVISKB_1895 [Levilactobacillus brevis KB290]